MPDQDERDERAQLESEFPVVLEVPVAWGDMDSMAHVNNIVYFRYFESARMRYFEKVGFLEEMRASGIGPILASTECTFRKPLTYPDTIWVGARVGRVESDDFLMEYRIVSRKLGKIATHGQGLVVSYDYRNGRRAPIPESVRNAVTALERKDAP